MFINIFNPFLAEAICRVLASILFIFSYFKLLTYFENSIEDSQKQQFKKFSLFFWILPIVMVRFSSESISASLFWLGFYYFNSKEERINFFKLILVGFLWGISFYIRMHLAILIGIFFLWILFYRRNRIFDFGYIFIGFIFSTGVEFILNYWLYNNWIWSPYLYFKTNVIDGIANQFGEMPFYYYFTELIKNLQPPIGIFILIGVATYVWRNKSSLFSWLICGFILIHSMVSHKEYRFLFPIFPLLIPLAYIGYQSLSIFKWKSKILSIIWIINIILLPTCIIIHSFNPYNYLKLYPYTLTNKKIYTDKPNPYALGDRFYTVRPYFWKSPSCEVIELDSLNSNLDITIFITRKDKGASIQIGQKTLEKSFQTIPKFINNYIPESIKSSIDYLYIYQVKK